MSEENNPQPEDIKEDAAPKASTDTSSNEKVAASQAPRNDEPAEADASVAPAAPETPAAPEAPEEAKSTELPYRNLKPGMTVRVHETIKDFNSKGVERERVQVFEGVILGFGGSEHTRTITVRKVSGGIGVEKVYPLSSPHVAEIEVVKEVKTRRSKLWFLRKGFKRRLKEVKKA
ncbi:50S ribosomal protein L19 [Candidatus Uhrbacteria bacterium]|nr:50S ribosomal protein L19 [Candidatus Uhrbacteria bacterium]